MTAPGYLHSHPRKGFLQFEVPFQRMLFHTNYIQISCRRREMRLVSIRGMVFVLCCGLYPCNLSPTCGKQRLLSTKLPHVTATLNCLAQPLLMSLFPLGLGTDVAIFQGHHWTEAWCSVGAVGVSQFCEVSVVLASPPAELCWSLEELGAFP